MNGIYERCFLVFNILTFNLITDQLHLINYSGRTKKIYRCYDSKYLHGHKLIN